MWRIVQALPRAVRGQLSCNGRCQAPQVISREEEQEAQQLVLVPRRQLRTCCHQRSRHKKEEQGKEEDFHKKRDHHRNGTESQWSEWLRSFASSRHSHCTADALGWGSALVLGLQLSQVWHHIVSRKNRDDEKRCFLRHFHGLSRAVLSSGQISSSSHMFPVQSVGHVTSTETGTVNKQENVSRHPVTKNLCQTQSQLKVKEIPNVVLLEDDLCEKSQRFTTSPLSSTNECSEAVKLRASADTSCAPRDEGKFNQQDESFANDWEQLTTLYMNMRSNSVAVRLAKQGDHRQAALMWRAAAEQGYNKAHYNLAVCYEQGQGVNKSLEKAVEHYTIAAEAGHPQAMYNLSQLHIKGSGGLTPSTVKAVQLLEEAAGHGLAEAQVDLGVLYTRPDTEDLLRASELFEMAARQKNTLGQFYLGMCYELGWGVHCNECKAAQLYQKASVAGHAGAMYCLGMMFELGKGGLPENKQEALVLYDKAACQGHRKAGDASIRLSSDSIFTGDKTNRLDEASVSNSRNSPLKHIADSPSVAHRRVDLQISQDDSSDSSWSSSDSEDQETESEGRRLLAICNRIYDRSLGQISMHSTLHKSCSSGDLQGHDGSRDLQFVACV